MPFRFALRCFALSLLTLFLSASLSGCLFGGGDAGASEDIGLIDFGEDPTPVPVAVKAKSIGVDGLVLEEINYLYGHQVWLESLVRLNRDMASVLESAGKSKEPVGLDWVIDVHNVTTYADEIFGLTLAKNTPVAQRESYSGLYLAELEVIQVMAFGRDRLLSAALVLGPAGRTVGVLDTGESATFNTFLREADFFLRDSERLLDQQTKLVGAALARVRIR